MHHVSSLYNPPFLFLKPFLGPGTFFVENPGIRETTCTANFCWRPHEVKTQKDPGGKLYGSFFETKTGKIYPP